MAVELGGPPRLRGRLAAVLLAGAAVSVALGVYGNLHDPAGRAVFTLGFSSTLAMKAWLATGAAVLALFQLVTGLRLFGKIPVPRRSPAWLGDAHRLAGTIAFLLTLPVAYHCLWSLGFESAPGELRRFAHSLLGCAFYGAFATKVLIVRSRRLPGWVLPLAGGTTFTLLVGLWYTSSLWYFQNHGFPGL